MDKVDALLAAGFRQTRRRRRRHLREEPPTRQYHNVTARVLERVDAGAMKEFLESTTSEFHSCLVGSATTAKPTAYADAAGVTRYLFDEYVASDPAKANGGGAVLAATLVENLFAAGMTVFEGPERETFGWVDGNPEMDARWRRRMNKAPRSSIFGASVGFLRASGDVSSRARRGIARERRRDEA